MEQRPAGKSLRDIRILVGLFFLLLLVDQARSHPKARVFDARDVTSVKVAIDRVHRGPPIRKVVLDPGGVIWGINGIGSLVVRMPKSRKWVREDCPSTGDLSPGSFNHLVRWGDRLVLGSPYSGLVLYSAGSWKPLMPKSMEGGRRIHGFVVHQEDLWAATSDGLFVFDSKTLRREKRALPEDLSGVPSALGSNGAALVVATDSAGLAVWENDSWDVLATGEEGLRRPVQALIADGGRVILGGAGWLEEWRLMGGFKDILAENPSLGKLIVSDLCLLDGILWVSTIGQGLLHRKDGRWDQLLPPFQDLGSSNLYSLTPTPEGQVLAAHSLGLSRIRVVSK